MVECQQDIEEERDVQSVEGLDQYQKRLVSNSTAKNVGEGK